MLSVWLAGCAGAVVGYATCGLLQEPARLVSFRRGWRQAMFRYDVRDGSWERKCDDAYDRG